MTDANQCPTCGRVDEDWASNRPDLKGRQRGDREDRCRDYRGWRWKFGGGLYASDVDQIEWRIENGVFRPVAVLELTRVDGNIPVPQSYLDRILLRFGERDGQGKIARRTAELLGCKAWIVAFRWSVNEFWVYNLTDGRGWWHTDRALYRKWIEGLGTA
jgi:hypothetical protein